MQTKIENFLTNAECDYIETISDDIENPLIRYYCECADVTEKSWILLQNNTKCKKCMEDDETGEKDINIIRMSLSMGFVGTKVKRLNKSNNTNINITYTCKCNKTRTVDSYIFGNICIKGCDECKKSEIKNNYIIKATEKGFKDAKYDENRDKNGKPRPKLLFTCKCGKTDCEVQISTFDSPEYKGCKDCKSGEKSMNIRKTLNSINEDRMKEYLETRGFANMELIGGTTAKTYKVNYNCTCGNIVEKLWRSVITDPLCKVCIVETRKGGKNDEIKDVINSKGYIYKGSYRIGDKSRIMIQFECKCGNDGEKLWEVMKRESFTGCDNCYGTARMNHVTEKFHTEEADEKRKATNMERYGFECNLQNPEVKEKIKETNQKKRGVNNVSQCEVVKEKKRETLMENYGVDSPGKSKEIRDRMELSLFKKYGKTNPSKIAKIHIKQQKFSTYISESGKEYKYQGYEHFAIKEFIKSGIDENKIKTCYDLCESEEMPDFTYINDSGKECSYFPDMRIEDENGNFIYIEVKAHNEVFSIDLDKKIQSVTDKDLPLFVKKYNPSGKLVKEMIYYPEM